MSEEELKELEHAIKGLTITPNDKAVSAYNSINVDDLMNTIKSMKKVPSYDEIIRENNRLQQEISKYKELYVKALDNTIKSDRELMKYKEANKKAIEYIKKYDIKKHFTFPLMKRWEENEIKDSIEYEFKDGIYKDLLKILEVEDV